MEAVFERKKRLLPRPTDLSFYNWDTQMATSNATANFQVQAMLTSLISRLLEVYGPYLFLFC